MLHPRKRKTPCQRVGLDIGSHTINGVEIVERDGEMVVRSVGAVQVPVSDERQSAPDAGAVVHALKSLWSSARFECQKVVVALPADAVYVKWLHLEAPSRDELDVTARTAAVRGAPFPVEHAVVDYRILLSRGTTSRNVYFVMLVAANQAEVDRVLTIVESAGLEPEAVDIGAVAALHSFDTQKRVSNQLWRGQPLAHCIVGASNTTIIVARGGELEFARTVPVGGNDFTQCIAEHCKVSRQEADRIKTTPGNRLIQGGALLASRNEEELRIPCENVVGRLSREIQRSLRFFTSQFAEGSYLGMIGGATMSGGGALLKGLDTCLQEQGIDISGTVNPFTALSVDAEGGGIQHVSESAAQYTTAVGLAIGDRWAGVEHDAPSIEIAA